MREKLTAIIFILILGGFFILNRVITPPEISQSERRPLEKMPELSFETVKNAAFMDGFESFAADSFVFRDTLRAVRAFNVFYIYNQTDKDGIYIGESGFGKFEPVNEQSWRQVTDKIKIIGDVLKEKNISVYYSFVPDKSIYSGRELPGFHADLAREIMTSELPDYTLIDITNSLSGENFYRTDLHWRQNFLKPVVDTLGEAMGFKVDFARFNEVTAGEFQGVYTGQAALPMRADMLTYLKGTVNTAMYINERTLEWYESDVYDSEAFSGRDPYDIFLKGPQPLIVLENPDAASDKELYLFRDSFGSSIAPVLAEAYRKITLIDLRYIDWRMLPALIEFNENADALFLYSSQIMNNASVLLVK
ncbi:MAG: DHHW family protein [Oscillospiraceae bacterium]|nr:DHHW family protein [Oscillospiraceae bacterium]